MQQDKATVIGESIFVSGHLSGDEDLTVLGRVEGTISLSQTLFVAESGIVKADVTVDDAVISGIVVGNVTATNSVQVTETGRLLGDLRAPRIMIVAGARVRGQVDMSGAAAGQSSRERDAAAEARAQQRGAHGRFERLGLPARRPMPQAPSVARSTQPAHRDEQRQHPQHAQHQHQQAQQANQRHQGQAHGEQREGEAGGAHERDAHGGREASAQYRGQAAAQRPTTASGAEQAEDATVTASAAAPRRAVTSHHKKRAAARRRD